MKKKFGARQFSLETLVGGRPGTTIFQNRGGEGGGGWGGSHTRTGPGHPPLDDGQMDHRDPPGGCATHRQVVPIYQVHIPCYQRATPDLKTTDSPKRHMQRPALSY